MDEIKIKPITGGPADFRNFVPQKYLKPIHMAQKDDIYHNNKQQPHQDQFGHRGNPEVNQIQTRRDDAKRHNHNRTM